MAITAAISAVVVSTASTVASISASNKAAKSSQRLQQLKANQQRRQQIREARIRRGRVANVAVQTGVQGSSAEFGAKGSIQSQLATNLSFLDQSLGLAQRISSQQVKAQTFSGIASLSNSAFNLAGGSKTIAKAIK